MEINVSQTPNEIENTLPLVYDTVTDKGDFDFTFGKCSLHSPVLSVTLLYFVHPINDESIILGKLRIKTIFEIKSSHTKIACYQILHECTTMQIDFFKSVVKKSGVINHPLNIIVGPTFEDLLKILRDFWGDER